MWCQIYENITRSFFAVALNFLCSFEFCNSKIQVVFSPRFFCLVSRTNPFFADIIQREKLLLFFQFRELPTNFNIGPETSTLAHVICSEENCLVEIEA